MKSKSNPKGIRKGHWVTSSEFENKGNAYYVQSVKNGFATILWLGDEWPLYSVKKMKRLKFGQKGYNFNTK